MESLRFIGNTRKQPKHAYACKFCMEHFLLALTSPTAKVPQFATPGAGAMDLCADLASPLFIPGGQTLKVPTGVAIALKAGQAGLVLARSGNAARGIQVANAPGLIDSDYRGEIQVLLYNSNIHAVRIDPHQRIAQLMIVRHETLQPRVVDSLPATDRGTGGFGSTGDFGIIKRTYGPGVNDV